MFPAASTIQQRPPSNTGTPLSLRPGATGPWLRSSARQVLRSEAPLGSHSQPFSLPIKDKRARKCVAVMDQALVSAGSVSCSVTGPDEVQLAALRTKMMHTVRALGFRHLRNVKKMTLENARLWEEALKLHPKRLYDIVLFKNVPKPDNSIYPGDVSKLACQLGDGSDPSLALLKLLHMCCRCIGICAQGLAEGTGGGRLMLVDSVHCALTWPSYLAGSGRRRPSPSCQ